MRHLPGDRRCVLIIDDDPVFTLLAGETLAQAGFVVPVAHRQREALDLFETAEAGPGAARCGAARRERIRSVRAAARDARRLRRSDHPGHRKQRHRVDRPRL